MTKFFFWKTLSRCNEYLQFRSSPIQIFNCYFRQNTTEYSWLLRSCSNDCRAIMCFLCVKPIKTRFMRVGEFVCTAVEQIRNPVAEFAIDKKAFYCVPRRLLFVSTTVFGHRGAVFFFLLERRSTRYRGFLCFRFPICRRPAPHNKPP